MKKLIFLLLTMTYVHLASAQTAHIKNVPSPVKTSFTKLFPEAKSINWLKVRSDYQAKFKLKEADATALIDAEGNLLKLETTIPVNQLPDDVKEYVKKHFPSTSITAATMIQDGNGKVTYQAVAMGLAMFFDHKGKLLR